MTQYTHKSKVKHIITGNLALDEDQAADLTAHDFGFISDCAAESEKRENVFRRRRRVKIAS